MTAYAEAYLGNDAVAPADALTVSPYLGYESLRPAIDLAAQTGRGLFVLALTSNPEGRSVQHAIRDGRSVAASVVDGARADNADGAGRGELGHVGLVIGATVGDAVERLGPRPRRRGHPGPRPRLRGPGRHRRRARGDVRPGARAGARLVEP